MAVEESFGKPRSQFSKNPIIAVVVIIVAIGLFWVAGNTIKVPYTAMVTETVKEPYTEEVCETKDFAYNVEQTHTGSFCSYTICGHRSFWQYPGGNVNCMEASKLHELIKNGEIAFPPNVTRETMETETESWKCFCCLNEIQVKITNLEMQKGKFSVWLGFNFWKIDGGTVKNGLEFTKEIQPFSSELFDRNFVSAPFPGVPLYEVTKVPTKTECKEVTRYKDVEKQQAETRYRTLFEEWGLV